MLSSGALKSNIGHLEGGSGLAGIIKTIMVLEAGIIPPNANSHVVLDDALNYLRQRGMHGMHHTFDWMETSAVCGSQNGAVRAQCLRQLAHIPALSWECSGDSNGAVASAMTNDFESTRNEEVHLTANLTHSPNSAMKPTNPGPNRLLIFSAADEHGLKRLGDTYEAYFRNHHVGDGTYLDHLAYTLSVHRSSMSWKSFAILNTVESLKDISLMISKPLSPISDASCVP